MKRLFILFPLLLTAIIVRGQTQPFGKIDTAELKMTSCDFEKDANAMILFDKAEIHYKYASIVMERHKRIKIFNENGKDEANIRIEYHGAHNNEDISDIKAQTINLSNNIVEYTPVDKKLIYTEKVDKNRRAIVFSFPGVKSGSVIEFEYKWSTPYPYNYPDWFFEASIPTRYNELEASFNKDYPCTAIRRVNQKFFIDTAIFLDNKNHAKGQKFVWALKNIESFKIEPYMTPMLDNIKHVIFQMSYTERTWLSICHTLADDDDFGKQLNIPLSREDEILAKVNTLKTADQKIAYIFDLVKNKIEWNKVNDFYTYDGVVKAWENKKGNSTEINLILCRLLKQAGINASPVLVSTRGKINPFYPSTTQLDKTVIYFRADSTKQYVMDATDKYNIYNETPFELLNSNGIYIDPGKKDFYFISLQSQLPVRQITVVNADIKPDGKMNGAASISEYSYNRASAVKRYKTDGEKKFIDFLRENDNNVKISSLKFENMEIDSLPLVQNIDFSMDLPGSDDQYIYFNPNIFTGLSANPFLSEKRISDIDFGCLNTYTINGRYKVPTGYKVDVLPKIITITIADKSIVFKREVAEQNGYIVVHYTIYIKKSLYSKDDYPDIHTFYKKMYEMLNEQVVLKKV